MLLIIADTLANGKRISWTSRAGLPRYRAEEGTMKQSYSTYHIIKNMETELFMSLHYPLCNTHMCVYDTYTQKHVRTHV